MNDDTKELITLSPLLTPILEDTANDDRIYISKSRLRKLKRRLKRLNRREYERFKRLVDIFAYNLVLELIMEV